MRAGEAGCFCNDHGELLHDTVRRIMQLPRVSKVILFGSYAKGTQSEESDVDLAVFFDTDKKSLLDEYRALVGICRSSEIDIQIQAFHISELDEPCGIIEEIANYGVELTADAIDASRD